MTRRPAARVAVLVVRLVAAPFAPFLLPHEAAGQAREASFWRVDTRALADVGYDTNVFQTDSAIGDGFSRVGGALNVERRAGRTRLEAYTELSRKFYWQFSQADELEAFLDLTGSRSLGAVLVGVAARSAYVDMRFLDREGNLLPRTTFASFSSRALAFGDWRIGRTLYVAGQGGYRLKDYEETRGLTSLDYHEWSAELEATRYFPGRVSLRLEGVFEARDYEGRRAANASGITLPENPLLRLRRWQGEVRLRKRYGREGLVEALGGIRSSEDLFQDELTYDQLTAAARLRQPLPWALLRLAAGYTDRDFVLRRSGTGEPLEEQYLTFEIEAERRFGADTRLRAGYALFRRSSNDRQGGYTVGTFQLGAAYEF